MIASRQAPKFAHYTDCFCCCYCRNVNINNENGGQPACLHDHVLTENLARFGNLKHQSSLTVLTQQPNLLLIHI